MPIPELATVLAAGILVGCAGAALVWRPRRSSGCDKWPLARPNCAASPRARRLADEQAQLERLDAERLRRADASFGRTAEERIVWNELLELELQDLDERMNGIKGAPRRAA